MSKNEQRLTARELELKNEVSELVKQLNERLLQLKKNGITNHVSSILFNDGQLDEFIGLKISLHVSV